MASNFYGYIQKGMRDEQDRAEGKRLKAVQNFRESLSMMPGASPTQIAALARASAGNSRFIQDAFSPDMVAGVIQAKQRENEELELKSFTNNVAAQESMNKFVQGSVMDAFTKSGGKREAAESAMQGIAERFGKNKIGRTFLGANYGIKFDEKGGFSYDKKAADGIFNNMRQRYIMDFTKTARDASGGNLGMMRDWVLQSNADQSIKDQVIKSAEESEKNKIIEEVKRNPLGYNKDRISSMIAQAGIRSEGFIDTVTGIHKYSMKTATEELRKLVLGNDYTDAKTDGQLVDNGIQYQKLDELLETADGRVIALNSANKKKVLDNLASFQNHESAKEFAIQALGLNEDDAVVVARAAMELRDSELNMAGDKARLAAIVSSEVSATKINPDTMVAEGIKAQMAAIENHHASLMASDESEAAQKLEQVAQSIFFPSTIPATALMNAVKSGDDKKLQEAIAQAGGIPFAAYKRGLENKRLKALDKLTGVGAQARYDLPDTLQLMKRHNAEYGPKMFNAIQSNDVATIVGSVSKLKSSYDRVFLLYDRFSKKVDKNNPDLLALEEEARKLHGMMEQAVAFKTAFEAQAKEKKAEPMSETGTPQENPSQPLTPQRRSAMNKALREMYNFIGSEHATPTEVSQAARAIASRNPDFNMRELGEAYGSMYSVRGSLADMLMPD